MSGPLVTVACPVYRHGAFVRQCLDAVAAQTIGGAHLQLIIIDDLSPDDSVAVIDHWLRTCTLPHVTFIRHTANRGLWYGLQEAFEAAEGRYFCISSGDDFMHPHMLKALTDALEQAGPDAACAYADHDYVDAQGRITGTTMLGHRYANKAQRPVGHILPQAIWQAPFVTQAAMFRTAAMRAIGHRYRPEIICEDWDLILQLAAHGYVFAHVDAVVASYRTDPQMPSMLRSYDQRARRNRMHASIMHMMLDAMRVPAVPEKERQQMAAKCLDAARQAMWNPGSGTEIRKYLDELDRSGKYPRASMLRSFFFLRLNALTSLLALMSDRFKAILSATDRFAIRAKEKAILTLKGR